MITETTGTKPNINPQVAKNIIQACLSTSSSKEIRENELIEQSLQPYKDELGNLEAQLLLKLRDFVLNYHLLKERYFLLSTNYLKRLFEDFITSLKRLPAESEIRKMVILMYNETLAPQIAKNSFLKEEDKAIEKWTIQQPENRNS